MSEPYAFMLLLRSVFLSVLLSLSILDTPLLSFSLTICSAVGAVQEADLGPEDELEFFISIDLSFSEKDESGATLAVLERSAVVGISST
jgi:hypothetical protein